MKLTIYDVSHSLEDLQRRRFIKDLGNKREVFEISREGYQAADQLDAAKN